MSALYTTVLFIISALLAGCGPSPLKSLERGKALMKQERHAGAALEFKKAIQGEPSLADAHYWLGQAAARTGDLPAALASYEQAMRYNPKHLDARQRLAELYTAVIAATPRASEDLHAKVEDLLGGLESDPSRRVDILRLRATSAMAAGRPAAAAHLIEKTSDPAALPPDLGLIRFQALLLTGRNAEAAAAVEALMQRHPAYAPAYSIYASYLLATRRTAEAEAVLRRQVERNPDSAPALLELASFLAGSGRTGEADLIAGSMESRQPASAGFLFAAGDYWLARRESQRALDVYRRGLTLDAKVKPAFVARMFDVEILRGNEAAALRTAGDGLREFPKDFELQRKRSLLLLASAERKQREEARSVLLELLSEKPKETPVRLRLAASYAADGKSPEAMEQWRQAVNRQPGNHTAQLALGQALLRTGQPSLALERAQAALILVPNLVAGLELKVASLSELRRFSELRTTLNELRGITPDSPVLAREFGWLALREGKLADAERELRRARKEIPADSRTMLGLVRVLVAKQSLPAALEEVAQARKKEPARPDFRLMEGEILHAMGQPREARALLAGLASEFPEFAEPRVQLSQIAWEEGDTAASLRWLAEAKSAAPNDPSVLRVYGARLDALNRFSESAAIHREAQKLEPANPIIWNNLAFALAASGQELEKAEQLARQAAAKIPGQPGVLDTLGFVLLQRGKAGEAVKLFSGLAERHSTNPVYRYHYGLALRKSGDVAAARRQFTQALSLSPAPRLESDLRQALNEPAS